MAKKCRQEYDESLKKYIPVLMAEAKIFWDLEDYEKVCKTPGYDS